MPIALITGATAGLGAEFARQLAERGYALIMVARDLSRLEESAERLRTLSGTTVTVLAADLTVPAELARVEERLAAADEPVDLLVNNAGLGLMASFEASAVSDQQHMIDLMVTAPMRLMHAVLPPMIARGSGTILNVASVAGYTPRSTYGAAKAWLISFSRWASVHYRSQGVTVTVVAPGFVHTEFHDRMAADKSSVPSWMWMDAKRVVRVALAGAERGARVVVPGTRYKVLVAVSRVLPASLVAKGSLRAR